MNCLFMVKDLGGRKRCVYGVRQNEKNKFRETETEFLVYLVMGWRWVSAHEYTPIFDESADV